MRKNAVERAGSIWVQQRIIWVTDFLRKFIITFIPNQNFCHLLFSHILKFIFLKLKILDLKTFIDILNL